MAEQNPPETDAPGIHVGEIVLSAEAVAEALRTQTPEYECYSDQTLFGMSTYTFSMVFALSGLNGLKNLAEVKMSAEHAKVFSIMLTRTLKHWEESRGAPINVPRNVLSERGINLETDW